MTDRYIRDVLTVIAAALVALLIQNAVSQSSAQQEMRVRVTNEFLRVQICEGSLHCVGTEFGRLRVAPKNQET